jgi:hypothetical protein
LEGLIRPEAFFCGILDCCASETGRADAQIWLFQIGNLRALNAGTAPSNCFGLQIEYIRFHNAFAYPVPEELRPVRRDSAFTTVGHWTAPSPGRVTVNQVR